MVAKFSNKEFSPPPGDLMKDFESEVESVSAFDKRVREMEAAKAQEAFQMVLLLGLNDSKVGMYSTFHDFAVWKFGYNDPRTIRVAYVYVLPLLFYV